MANRRLMQVGLSVSSSSLITISVPPGLATLGGRRATVCDVRSFDVPPGFLPSCAYSASGVLLPIAPETGRKEILMVNQTVVNDATAGTPVEDAAVTPE